MCEGSSSLGLQSAALPYNSLLGSSNRRHHPHQMSSSSTFTQKSAAACHQSAANSCVLVTLASKFVYIWSPSCQSLYNKERRSGLVFCISMTPIVHALLLYDLVMLFNQTKNIPKAKSAPNFPRNEFSLTLVRPLPLITKEGASGRDGSGRERSKRRTEPLELYEGE